jgi:hypothetical protein
MIKININKYKNTSIKINSLIFLKKFHLYHHIHLKYVWECGRTALLNFFKLFFFVFLDCFDVLI